jgi:hypothetical protein
LAVFPSPRSDCAGRAGCKRQSHQIAHFHADTSPALAVRSV